MARVLRNVLTELHGAENSGQAGEGRKEGISAEKDLGRLSRKWHSLSSGVSAGGAFSVQQAACSWTLQEVCKGTPWDDQTLDKPVSADLSAGDKTPRNLWKVPERTLIPVFKKKALGFYLYVLGNT